jgi:hypothetical protein
MKAGKYRVVYKVTFECDVLIPEGGKYNSTNLVTHKEATQ